MKAAIITGTIEDEGGKITVLSQRKLKLKDGFLCQMTRNHA